MKDKINIELNYIELTRIILALEKNIELMDRGEDRSIYSNTVLDETEELLKRLRVIKRAKTMDILD